MTNYLTTAQASEHLGVSIRRVQALIKSGRLKATKHGRDYLIAKADLKEVEDRKPGKPRKND